MQIPGRPASHRSRLLLRAALLMIVGLWLAASFAHSEDGPTDFAAIAPG
jgi:hypothetical protein